MMFWNLFRILALCLLSTAALTNASYGQCSCTPNATFTTEEYHSDILNKYLTIWAGDFSNINQTLTPNFGFYQDRLPFGPETIQNPSELEGWVEHSRGGWTRFDIKVWFWFGSGYNIALRWYLDGIIANVSAHAPGSSLPSGSYVTYNGTDLIHIDPCSGLIYEVDSAQDFMDYFYNLGLRTISLRP